jgi:GT2 family glycosyltransferase
VCLQEEGADAVSGRILPEWAGGRPAWMTEDVAPAFVFGALGCVDHGPRRLTSTSRQSHYWVGANLALRRDVLEALGGFDVQMVRAQDTELQGRCLRAGKKIVYEPQALVHHTIGPERLTPEYFRGWWHRRGRYAALRSPWRLSHLITVDSLGWYTDVCRLLLRWTAAFLLRRPWGERFTCEVRLRERGSRWLNRARLLPAVWGAVFTRGWRFLDGQMNALDLQRAHPVEGA